jgi:hypothetical protein
MLPGIGSFGQAALPELRNHFSLFSQIILFAGSNTYSYICAKIFQVRNERTCRHIV